jgi:hypothetical protein
MPRPSHLATGISHDKRNTLLLEYHRTRETSRYWNITNNFFDATAVLYNALLLGLAPERFPRLFFLFGLHMSLAIFLGEGLSNCEFLTVFRALCGEAVTLMTVMDFKNASLQTAI